MSSSTAETYHMECPKCGDELLFECDSPDYSVGIYGYSCNLVDAEYRPCDCEFTDEEQETLEHEASTRLTEGDYWTWLT